MQHLVVVLSLHFSFLIVFSLKHIAVPLPDPLPIFELLVLMTDELPQLCVGVQESLQQQNERQLKFDIIHLNGTPNPQPGKWLTDCWSCMNSGLKNCTTNITFKPIPMNSTDFSLSLKKIWKTYKFCTGLLCFIHWHVCECVIFVSFLRHWDSKSCTSDTAGQRHGFNCTGKYVWFISMINTWINF